MPRILPWAVALIPLVIAPWFSFYFDVIPRLVLALLIAAGALILRRDLIPGVRELLNGRAGRWFCIVGALQAVSLFVSSIFSTNPWLSVSGSTWRRFGLISQAALLTIGIVLAADLNGRPERLRQLLRAFTATGLAAGVYGIFQYFGKDPFLDSASYHTGEGVWAIVRPPGTLGHASYFGVYLLMAGFSAGAVALSDTRRTWRRFAAAAAAVVACCIVLTGTRAAMLGAVIGSVVLVYRLRPRFTLRHAVAALLIVSGSIVFYASSAGERIRARVRWSIEDAYGGARFWLWRDSLRMSAERPVLGHGPDTFHVVFPRYQSLELSRAYPDFQHESPHNIVLDALTAQGVIGAVAVVALLFIGVAAGIRAPPELRNTSAALLGCLAALVAAQQFCSPTVATALCLIVTTAALVSLSRSEAASAPAPRLNKLWAPARVALAIVFTAYAVRLMVADAYLARTRDNLARLKIPEAVRSYETAAAWLPQGASADLYYSRAMAASSSRAPDPTSALQAWQQAMTAGTRALRTSDDGANAAYNLASLCAATSDLACTEDSLRTAIARSPAWFKPHWTLARVLALSGRLPDAEAAAVAAAERNGGRNEEVLQTLQEIRQRTRKP